MAILKELEIIKQCQNGDLSAFRYLFEREKSKMFNTAVRICGNYQDAEDCIQEAFIRIYRNISNFKFESAFSTYVYRILVNTCLTHRSKNQSQIVDISEETDLTIRSTDFELTEKLESAIQKLTGNNKAVFVLYEIEGFTHIEISEMLDISIGTSKSCLSRAKEKLQTELKEYKHYEF